MRRARLLGALVCCLVLVVVASVEAQVTGCNLQKKWEYASSEIYWEFTTIIDPPPTGFRVKVGTSPKIYTVTRDVPATQFSLAMTALIPGPGMYYAIVVPLEGTMEKEPSAECFFELGRTVVNLGVRKIP